MGKIAPSKPVKLIIGFIFKEEQSFFKSKGMFIQRFGKIDTFAPPKAGLSINPESLDFARDVSKDGEPVEPQTPDFTPGCRRIDFESRPLPFTLTDYYEEEFGKDLLRVFVSFTDLIPPEQIVDIKILTNKIEEELSSGNKRLVNIDPGYLDLAKLILVSTKDYIHRIYLDKGIYAETTLFYRGKSFEGWQWTYPDFRTTEYIDIFNQIRKLYAKQITV